MRSGGYTLIELMVAISIMAILGIIAFVNFKDFSQDQILNKAVGQVQTYLRLAQSNATSGLKCNDNPAESWMIEFETNQTDIKLKCKSASSADIEKQTLTLEGNVIVDSISGTTCVNATFHDSTMTVVYGNLYGKPSFILAKGRSNECIADVSSITITLKRNSSTPKSLVINKGGAIRVQ